MGSGAKRSRGRREPLADQVERAGHVVLTSLWTACVWLLRMILRYAWRVAAHAGRWLLRQRRWVQLAVVAGLGAGAVAAYHVLTTRPEPAVYVDDETEALARVIRSEAGTSSAQQRIHVAWVTRNLAAERGQTVAQMACSPCGEQQLGRPVSSRQDATEPDRELARYILLSPPLLDPTGGATHFINPTLQDDLASAGRPGYRGRPYSDVRQRWMQSYGWEPYYRLGPDLELWGPRRRARVRGARTGAK
ncbi:MAG TPA: hypothetical protein VK698_15695 [Kofleriaceae bacterium]|nr:hypothetical protein [Kofleriaceae bacterium]